MIIFIGCGKKKNNSKCKAKDMYQGNFFHTCLQYARTLGGNIYILSAKYGILNLETDIEPYDLTLNNMNKKQKEEWYKKVVQQLQDRNLDTTQQAVFLCGKNYYEGLLHLFQNNQRPLENLGGMGYQIQWMKNKMKRRLFL